MSLSARCKAVCDGCGKEVINDVVLNDDTAQGIMSKDDGEKGYCGRSYARDIWSWCIPEGWLQIPKDKVTKQTYLFFCNRECYKEWLRKQGRLTEIEKFNKAKWVA